MVVPWFSVRVMSNPRLISEADQGRVFKVLLNICVIYHLKESDSSAQSLYI